MATLLESVQTAQMGSCKHSVTLNYTTWRCYLIVFFDVTRVPLRIYSVLLNFIVIIYVDSYLKQHVCTCVFIYVCVRVCVKVLRSNKQLNKTDNIIEPRSAAIFVFAPNFSRRYLASICLDLSGACALVTIVLLEIQQNTEYH